MRQSQMRAKNLYHTYGFMAITDTVLHYLMAGHGRGYEMVRKSPEKYHKYVMDMCVNDTSYDMQCEGSRAAYTYDLTMLYDDHMPFLNKVVKCYEEDEVDTDWHLFQHLTDLLMLYAFESENNKAENAAADNNMAENAILKKYDTMYEKLMTRRYSAELHEICQCFEVLMIALTNWYEWDWVEKIAHDLGAWFIRRRRADKEDLKWQFNWLWSNITEKYGETEVKERLENSSSYSKETARFISIMYLPNENFARKKTKSESLSVEDIVKAVRKGENRRNYIYRVKNMPDNEKVKLAEAAVKESDVHLKAELISFFESSYLAWPIAADYLIGYADSENKELRDAAIESLTNVKDEKVAEFAKKRIAENSVVYYSEYIEMLINNCRTEDEDFLLNELEKIEIDQDNRSGWHAIVMDITHARDNDIPDSLLIWAYENTLCSCCRESIVERMIKKNILTPELKQECLHDANLDIRELV